MTRFVVAANYRWDEYPGLRAGRIAAGTGDVGRSPLGEAHLVAGPDAAETVCGLPRASFPYEFPELADVDPAGPSDPCAACRSAG